MAQIDTTLKFMSREEEEAQTQTKAKQLALPYINLVNYPIGPEVLKIIPLEQAKAHCLIPYLRTGKTVRIATPASKPAELAPILKQLEQASGYAFELVLCSKTSFDYCLKLKEIEAQTETVEAIEVKLPAQEESKSGLEIAGLEDLKDKISQATTTQIIDIIFAGAVAMVASDVHLEPEEKFLRLRFRIDGVLQDIAELEMKTYHLLSSRIKYLAKLKLDVKNEPQDGRFEITLGKEKIDVRVSTLPTAFGEVIEMRLLLQSGKFLTLDKLGFSSSAQKLIKEAITRPNGLILNTGPTGSGKTTTLYAMLLTLNQPGRKIITIEDPIEYRIPGIDQSQVDVNAKYTFDTGLRSILRQDPDIIMVGEIRDQETAGIALHAGLTGHLVLTTLHTNDAASALPRLIDMGIEAYLLAGSINLIIAQRLVRRVCQKCQGKGCGDCNHTGLSGRIVVAEALKPTKEIETLLQKKASLSEFRQAARDAGMETMAEDAEAKIKAGLTTREEVERVLGEQEKLT